MRKLIATFVLAAITLLPAAAEHARLLGVELNGSQQQFKQLFLRVKGVKCLESQCDSTAFVYSGTYAGVDNCTFYIFHQNGTVCAASISLPVCDSWNQLKGQFNQFRSDFRADATLRCTNDNREFKAPYSDGDGDEMIAVAAGMCFFRASFESDVAEIIISINKRKCVEISIFDNQNFTSADQHRPDANSTPFTTDSNDPSGQCLQFMGLNIAGKPMEFAQRLVNERGLTFHSRTNSGDCILIGSYNGIDGCSFGIISKNGRISSVGVTLPRLHDWQQLKAQYLLFKTALRNDYQVMNCTETFKAPYQEGDGDEMQAVQGGCCTFRTSFCCDHGAIALSIHKSGSIIILFKPN